jgi:signal transduction histidine kinase
MTTPIKLSIRLKFIMAILVCLVVVMLAGMHYLNQLQARAFEQEVQNRTELVSQFGQASRDYVSKQLRPAVEAQTDAWVIEAMSSTFATRNILENFNAQLPEYLYKQPTLNPLNPLNQADEFESQIIQQFQANPAQLEIKGYRQQQGQEKFYVARPIKVEASCLKCHGQASEAPDAIVQRYGRAQGYNWQVDDIVSALMIYVPTQDLRLNQVTLQKAVWGTFSVLTLILASAIFWLFDRLVNRRLQKIADVMRQGALTPGLTARLKDTTRDEIGLLARIFNQMADSLDSAYLNLEHKVSERTQELTQALQQLKSTQAQLVQAEKMSSLGELVAGLAHEINNPISFIHGNVNHAKSYFQTVLGLLDRYQQTCPDVPPDIQVVLDESDLPFIRADMQKLLSSMQTGSERIRDIVISLRNFSRLDESDCKAVNLHEGIENTLMILQHRLHARSHQPDIRIVKNYGQLPLVTCYPSQLNQAILNLLNNAIDALQQEEITHPTLTISTQATTATAIMTIADNGPGITETIQDRVFDPFFTTKPLGQGTGMGLAISYQIIVEKHRGQLTCRSTPGQGTEMIIEIPIS